MMAVVAILRAVGLLYLSALNMQILELGTKLGIWGLCLGSMLSLDF